MVRGDARGRARLEHALREAALTKTGKGMRAYVLIETAAGKTKSGVSSVVNLDAVTGPFDFIAVVEGPTLDAVGRLVTDEIGAIDGVTRTTTCLAVAL